MGDDRVHVEWSASARQPCDRLLDGLAVVADDFLAPWFDLRDDRKAVAGRRSWIDRSVPSLLEFEISLFGDRHCCGFCPICLFRGCDCLCSHFFPSKKHRDRLRRTYTEPACEETREIPRSTRRGQVRDFPLAAPRGERNRARVSIKPHWRHRRFHGS